MQLTAKSKSGIFTFLFFTVFLFLGLSITSDYGVTWDEDIQRKHGIISMKYVYDTFGKGFLDFSDVCVYDDNKECVYDLNLYPEEPLLDYEFRFYGTLFQSVALVIEAFTGCEHYWERTLLRHWMVFFLFFLASIAFYSILNRIFGNRYVAVLGTLCFILSPRLFANSFFNVKDSVNLSLYTLAIASCIRFFDRPTVNSAVLYALLTALAVNVRITAMILPILTFFWMLVYYISSPEKKVFIKLWKRATLVYFLLIPLFVYLFWPLLWQDPIQSFLDAYATMKKYPWGGSVLLFNQNLVASNLPWYYIPSWMLITIPLLYWFFFLQGSISKLIEFFRKSLKGKLDWFLNREDRIFIILLSFCVAPILAVIVMKSTLYNGWRQMHFVYTPFLLVSFMSAYWFWKEKILPKGSVYVSAFCVLIVFSLAYTAGSMIKNHPHQNVYFNALGKYNNFTRFELDYWGASYKRGFEKVADLVKDKDRVYTFKPENYPGYANERYVRGEFPDLFKPVWGKNGSYDFFITNFKSPSLRSQYLNKEGIFENEVLIIYSQNTPILGVFARTKEKLELFNLEKAKIK